jgi:transposase
MSQGARVVRPERSQLRWEMVDLDSRLPPEHRARLVWTFVIGLELSELYDRIKARDEQAGRPASDPAVLLALWLYATLDGVGSARAVARLCDYHAAYRWLCGGVAVNHDMLSAFRRDSGAVLDRLLTGSLTTLIAEGLVKPEEVAIDGTKVRARAGRGSLAQRKKLAAIEAAASASDPEVRSMRLPDGSVQPAWNVQVATANGFVVAIEPADRRKDSGLAMATLDQLERRRGGLPERLLADRTAATQDEIDQLSQRKPELRVYSRPPQQREDATAETKRKRRWQRRRESDAVKEWRTRMDSEAGKEVYRRRKLTEHAHAKMKNRGFVRMLVHGIDKVRNVCLLHALAHNFLQACGLRAAAAAAAG